MLIGKPVRTPGPTTTSGPSTRSSATWIIACLAVGTTLESATPSTSSSWYPSWRNSPARNSRYSSAVRSRSVESRHESTSSSPTNRPTTVCVFPTSIAMSTLTSS